MTLVELEADVVVAGGGMAGVCAAVAAARHGASCHKGRPGWREGGLIEEFRLDDAVNNSQRCWGLWDLLLYDETVSQPNITLLLESVLHGACTKDGRIEEVMVRCDKSEHIYRIKAKIFCDCTGHSRLALEAGAEMRSGQEARTELSESLAPEKADNETLGSSTLFTSRVYHKPMPFTPPKWARKIMFWEYGYWWIVWGGHLNTIRDNGRIRFELLSIVMGVWDYIKNSGEFPDSANWAMDWVGMMAGKRGSRRIIGDQILTQKDLLEGDFEDAVAIGGWPMDDHLPGSFERPDMPPNTVLRPPEVYNIPLRSLHSRNIGNLMMAGGNISCSHMAFTSARVMATCAVVGQAAGTAAAMCAGDKIVPRQIYQDKKKLADLQQTLLRDDQTIRDVVNEDPVDQARKATVTCNTADCQSDPKLVVDGHIRDCPKKGGKEVHSWVARMQDGGVWLGLAWPWPDKLSEVQITFDSGFQRELTLTSASHINKGIIRAPQPETVRDYRVYVRNPGISDWKEVASVKGNHQRLRRHRFDTEEAQAVRIHVTATNGDNYARVFEVRCYA